jgi:hypothetical protein
MKTISTKKHWISTDAWRGYEKPINAVCGANNTGNWSDSPCPENDCVSEIAKARKVLKSNGIKTKLVWCRSSNLFCVHAYLLTYPENIDWAKELIKPLIADTELLYIA